MSGRNAAIVGLERWDMGKQDSMRGLIACLMFACVAAGQAHGQASFDCARAASAVEHAICATSELADLDGRLNRAYGAARGQLREHERRTLIDQQRAWLRSRDTTCMVYARVDTVCLSDLYRRRLAELSDAGQARGRSGLATFDWAGHWSFARQGFDGAMRITPVAGGSWLLSIQTTMTSGNFSTCELSAEVQDAGGSLAGHIRDAGTGIRVDRDGDGLRVTQAGDSGMCGLNATFEGYYRRSGR